MEEIIKSYPVYESDQLLTSADLNLSFDYLEQQMRISRIGVGSVGRIVGYDYELGTEQGNPSQKIILLRAGLGVSIEGNVLLHTNRYDGVNEPWTGHTANEMPKYYKYMVKYQKADNSVGITKEEFRKLTLPPFSAFANQNEPVSLDAATFEAIEDTCYQLLTEEEKNAYTGDEPIINLSQVNNLESKLIVLYLAEYYVENTNCNQNSCNDEGKVKNHKVVTLLVDLNDTLFPKVNYIPTELEVLHLYSLRVITDWTKGEVMFEQYKNTINTTTAQNLAIIKSKLESLRTSMNDLPLVNMNSFANLMSSNAIDSIVGLINNNSVAHEHFHMSLDVQDAINEFVMYYNRMFLDGIYETITFLENRRMRCVVLGRLNTPVDKFDSYGYYKVTISSLTELQSRYVMLKRLYDRIFVLLFSFGRKRGLFNSGDISAHAYAQSIPLVNNQINPGIRLTPTRSLTGPIGERSLPIYYSYLKNESNTEDNAFINLWKGQLRDFEHATLGLFGPYDEVFDPGTHRRINAGTNRVMLSYEPRHYPYMLTEGLIGLNLYSVLKSLKEFVLANNLRFSVICCSLNVINAENTIRLKSVKLKLPPGTTFYNGVRDGQTLVLIVDRANKESDYVVRSIAQLNEYVHNHNLFYTYPNSNNYDFDFFVYRPEEGPTEHTNWLDNKTYYNGLNHFYNAIKIYKQNVVIPQPTTLTYTPITQINQLATLALNNLSMFGGESVQTAINNSNTSTSNNNNNPAG